MNAGTPSQGNGANRTYKSHVTYVFPSLALAVLLSATTQAEPAPLKVRWINGESVPGEMIDGNAEAMRWKTSLFADPLELKWTAIRRVEQPVASMATKDPFSITLRDGSHILGDLVEATDKTISIRSARHGDAALKRSEVLSIRRLRGGSLVTAGPVGDAGWAEGAARPKPGSPAAAPSPPSSIPRLVTGPGGALVIPYWNRGIAFEQDVGDPSDIEIHLRSSIRPEFRLTLEFISGQRFDIETWDEDLVVAMADEFRVIRKLAADDRTVKLRVCWDKTTRRCAIYTPEGEPVLEWQTPDVKTEGAARFVLMNKGRDLSMDFLRFRKWDGKAPSKIDSKQPRFELADGRILGGELIRASAGTLRVKLRGDSSEKDMPLSCVDALILSGDSVKSPQHEAVLNYADGTFLSGRMESIKDGVIALHTSFADAPVNSRFDALRQLLLDLKAPDGSVKETPLSELDRVVLPGFSLHGKFIADGAAQPRWLPVGGMKAASLKSDQSFEITRAFTPDAKLPTAPALFFTSSGDILPGSLHGLDRTGVEMDSDIMDGKKLPADSLTAIQFGASTQVSIDGFNDPGWRIIKGDSKTVNREKDSLSLEPGASIGHVAALQGSEIKLSMTSSGFSTVRLRLFCAGLEGEKSSNVMISHWGSYVYSGLETDDGQLADQIRTGIETRKPLAVKLVVQEKSVELHLNGVMAQKFAIAPSSRQGAGLIIEPASLWGNTVTSVTLSGFSSRSVPGHTWLPDVSTETKTQALTVPRFRKDDPARHAIIAANGDVLRGEIEGATESHFAFRSGLETLRVPRDRVKAAIWLKKPLPDATPAAEPSPAQKLLDHRIERRMNYSNGSFSSLIGAIEREAAGLKINRPAKQDARSFPFQFGGQTVGEALEQVCALFGLKYRLDKDGSIVIEQAPTIPKGLVQKSYWLKPDAFPEKASAQEILAAKGVPFPGGSSASWQAAARQLTVTNTTENLSKLGEVLAANFGGSLGSPTHWLLLTSGARLGLAVEKFDPDFVLGHHPVYGACKVPMAQIFVVRTSMPEPTTTMNSLQDWRLVFAPEPVLPETGGEGSPMLGKAAPAFKLTLLGGGDFDLAQERGKVVVLDFWATWCGPCIKSLPGLIEAMSAFPADQVKLIGVNQGEGGEVVKRFLEARGLKLTVAMDGTQSVARQYGVDGIPHTVIVGPDGKVAWVKTGFSPDGDTEAANAVKQLLAPH